MCTRSMRTDKSLRCSFQNAQHASHRFASSNAVCIIVLVSTSRRIGPSSPFSTIRQIATASWKSLSCFKQTLTASLRLRPRRKNAAAYSNQTTTMGNGIWNMHNEFALTISLFTQKSERVFQSCCPPSWIVEVIGQEFQHDLLLGVPCCLFP